MLGLSFATKKHTNEKEGDNNNRIVACKLTNACDSPKTT